MHEAVHTRPHWFWTVAHYALVIGISSLLTLWRLGAPALESHEAYVAIAARNTVTPEHWLNPSTAEGPIPSNTPLNHWLIPVFNGEPRVVKTPLAYWCVAGLMKLGFPPDEFTARLPSALASVAMTVVVLALGRSMFSAPVALLGALMLATCVALVSWGRSARADMQMTLWMTVAMTCLYWAMQLGPSFWRHLLFLAAWGALGLANLAKQLGPLFLLLPSLLYLCWRASSAGDESEKPRRLLIRYLIWAAAGLLVCALVRILPALQWWPWVGLDEGKGMMITMAVTLGGPAVVYGVLSRVWRVAGAVLPSAVAGAVLMLAMFLPWMMYISNTLPQARHVFLYQTVDRTLGTDGWLVRSASSLTGYYFTSLAKWSLPWVAFLPVAMAIPLMRRLREDRNALVFLLLWVFGLVLLFSASVGKHEQYILPAVPPMCLLMGYCAEDVFFRHRWISLRLARTIVAGYALAVLGAAAGGLAAMAIVSHAVAPNVRHVLVVTSVALVPAWLAVWAIFRGRSRLAVAMMVLAVAAGELAFVSQWTLWNRKWEDYACFGQAIAHQVPTKAKLLAWAVPDPAIVWYSGRELPMASKQKARLVRIHGREVGEKMWYQWLTSSRRPFVLVGKETNASELSGLGFDPMASTATTEDGYCLFRR